MKVCFLTTSFPRFQGDYASVFIHDLAAEMTKGNTAVYVVTPSEAGLPPGERMGNIQVSRFTYFWPKRWQRIAYLGGIPYNLRHYRLAWLQMPLFLLIFMVKGLSAGRQCDLYHAHWIFSGLVGLLLSYFTGKPVVLTVHGSDVNVAAKNPLLRWMRRFVTMRVDKIIAVSDSLVEKLRDLDVPNERIALISNGVDVSIFPTSFLDNDFCFRLLWVGRMSPEKGLSFLLTALAEIVVRFPQTQLTLVGDGPLRAGLERLADDLGLNDHVCFTGFAAHEAVSLYLRGADLFVLPSLSEGLPLVVLEAMSAGKPVVATAVGGVPSLVVSEGTHKNGLLVPAEDVQALVEAITVVFTHPEKALQMGRNGRQLVEAQYTWTAVAQQTIQVYHEVRGTK